MNPYIGLSLAVLALLGGILLGWRLTRRSRKCTADGMPKVGTKWTTWDGKRYEIAPPATDMAGNPTDPMIRKGAFSAVIPRDQFHRLIKS